jgi:formylglycine-generating enzyme required for sulfatase activity
MPRWNRRHLFSFLAALFMMIWIGAEVSTFPSLLSASPNINPDARSRRAELTPSPTLPNPAARPQDLPKPGFVRIPAGPFQMGDNLDGTAYALPVHTVDVDEFFIDRYETTYTLWREVYDWALANGYNFDNPGSNGFQGKGDDQPVVLINWYDAVKWLNARSEREGRTPVYYTDDAHTTVYRTGRVDLTNAQVKWSADGYRLPTEAEWEKAARGGLEGKRYPWGDELGTGNANDSLGRTVPVGSYEPNGFGLYDMAGNVFEWVWDWGSESQAYRWAVDGAKNPRGPDSSEAGRRVRRGGGYQYGSQYLKCANRMFRVPTYSAPYFGFRSATNKYSAGVSDSSWQQAVKNAAQSRRAVRFCRRFSQGWLVHADPRSGLIPRNLTGDAYWNAKDAAADNYPFIVLTAYILDDHYLKQIAGQILAREEKLTRRLDSLPDDFLFETQGFRTEKPELDEIVFGAAEYAKDGLMPISEWLGPSPWLERMKQLTRDVFKHAAYETPAGKIPSEDVEVVGDLLQVTSRLYWMSGDEDYKTWAFRLADQYLLNTNLLENDKLGLRDHGSEIIGGLSEACVLASYEDPGRWQRYRLRIRALLDRILETGTNPDGLLYNAINPRTGEVLNKGLADTWGYVYNAYLTIAAIDNEPRYRDAAARALSNIHKYKDYDWENGSADGYADSVESAINLLNRLSSESAPGSAAASGWVDDSMEFIFKKQRDDGIIEGWHGDGNSARTALMWALAKTQGITASPWRDDLRLGAGRLSDGSVRVFLAADWPRSGKLRFDRRRHRDRMHLPLDYPRINQFSEWFTVGATEKYDVRIGEEPARTVEGVDLYEFPLTLKAGEPLRLTARVHEDPAAPKLRTMKYTPRSGQEAIAWQKKLRARLFGLLKMNDLLKAKIPLDARVLASEEWPGCVRQEVEFNSTPGRRIKAVVTVPRTGTPPYPAIVCIHGHGGSRYVVYDPANAYKGFAAELAGTGYVTIAADVGQHEVFESGRTLMGERLWDMMRCVDYLVSMKEVDKTAVGCAGLSLGGEMAMWLAAMDERVAACVSAGFLTVMDQMEHSHCMCWKFPGLRELVDFADIYSLIAPRPLLCQNGLREPPAMFVVPLARRALKEIRLIYADMEKPENVSLAVHGGEHEIDLPSLLDFFRKSLSRTNPNRQR